MRNMLIITTTTTTTPLGLLEKQKEEEEESIGRAPIMVPVEDEGRLPARPNKSSPAGHFWHGFFSLYESG